MILYHATPAENARSIMRHGLDPAAPGRGAGTARVHLSTDPGRFTSFVGMLYGTPDVAVFTVVATGLELEPGDDDDETEYAVSTRISPARLRLRRIVRPSATDS